MPELCPKCDRPFPDSTGVCPNCSTADNLSKEADAHGDPNEKAEDTESSGLCQVCNNILQLTEKTVCETCKKRMLERRQIRPLLPMPAQVTVIYHDTSGATIAIPVDHEQNPGIYVSLLQIKLNEAIMHIQRLEQKLDDGLADCECDQKKHLGP